MAEVYEYSAYNSANSPTRFVCVSDNHNHYDFDLPPGDILLHSGDFTIHGTEQEMETFLNWLKNLHQYRLKIFICGNHESKRFYTNNPYKKLVIAEQIKADRSLYSNYGIVYLQDQSFQDPVTGWKFYGSGFMAEYCKDPNEIAFRWSQIPTDADIILTHNPPYRIFDHAHHHHVGDPELLRVISTIVHPTLHLFGHAHGGYGKLKDERKYGKTIFINASLCDTHYHRVRPPVVIDLHKH